MENGNTDIKVQLAGLKKDIENVSNLNSRLDTAIEKLTDVSTSIKSMLAVHEEKLSKTEEGEQDMLDVAYEPKKNSRLSCQITVSDEIDGLVVTTPEKQI